MNNPVIMHCNYAEQGQTLEEMCGLAGRLGFEGIEFRRKRTGRDESAASYLDEIARAVEKHRIAHVVFGGPGPDLVGGDADSRRRVLDEVIAFYRLAAERFELSVCNITTGGLAAKDVAYTEFDKHGSNHATPQQWDAVVEGMQELGDLATELSFKLAFETHNVYLHDLPQPTRKLIDRIGRDSVGANLDFGNIILHPDGGTLEAACEALAGSIYMLHLKNAYLIPQRRYNNWIMSPLSEGAINNRQFLKLVKAQGFQGPIVIEAPRAGDREEFARQDLAYIREVMRQLG